MLHCSSQESLLYMEESAFPRAKEMHTKRRPKALIFLVIFLLVLSGLIFLGSRFLGTGMEEDEREDVLPTAVIAPSSTPQPEDEESSEEEESIEDDEEKNDDPTPTTKPTISSSSLDRSSLRIQVLNGSGIQGAASEMNTFLTEQGYTDITTGNADSFEYEDVSISVKSTKSNFLKQLETDLSDSYTIGGTDTSLSSSEYDVVIIIGQ